MAQSVLLALRVMRVSMDPQDRMDSLALQGYRVPRGRLGQTGLLEVRVLQVQRAPLACKALPVVLAWWERMVCLALEGHKALLVQRVVPGTLDHPVPQDSLVLPDPREELDLLVCKVIRGS